MKAGQPRHPSVSPPLPPRLCRPHRFWVVHRAIYRLTGGPASASGRRSPASGGRCASTPPVAAPARERAAILGYYEDGPNFVTLAMNGWAAARARVVAQSPGHPDATLDLHDRSMPVRGRAAEGEERERLWDRWQEPAMTSTASRRSDQPRQRSSSWSPEPASSAIPVHDRRERGAGAGDQAGVDRARRAHPRGARLRDGPDRAQPRHSPHQRGAATDRASSCCGSSTSTASWSPAC